MAHRRLAAIGLPVRVAGEADGGVDRDVGADRGQTRRIQRQQVLEPLDGVHDDDADEVEEQHRARIAAPAHLGLGRSARQPVQRALDRTERTAEDTEATLVHGRHAAAEGNREGGQDGEEDCDLEQAVRGHDSFSGASSATKR